MRHDDDLRDETRRSNDEEPTRLMTPSAEAVPQQRPAAEDETVVFRSDDPTEDDRADDERTVRTDLESGAADRPVGTERTPLDEDRPGIDRVTGESAGWGEPASATGYERDGGAPDEPTAVGLAKVERAEPDAARDTAVQPADEPSTTMYESGAIQTRTDEQEAAEQEAAVAAPTGDLRPGDAPAAPVETLWTDGGSQEYRERWREVQLLFVDEPRAAAEQAESLVSDVVDAFTGALAAQRESLAGWRGADKHDTEELRMAVRRYREFLNRLLDL